MQVSIIIVNFNTATLLKNCLNSIISQTEDIEYEIIVSDNGSTDGSIEMLEDEFPDVVLLKNNANLGFGKANNRGLSIAKGQYIFYLNSDTLLLNNTVKYFCDYMESHKKDSIGALGANLLNNENQIIHSHGKFPTFIGLSKILCRDIISQTAKYILNLLHIKREHFLNGAIFSDSFYGKVDYITGADLFVKNDTNAKFDEHYVLYYEETDLQKQMDNIGLERRIIDGPKIVHLEGGSKKTTGKKFTSFGNLMSYISMVYYCKKNISKLGSHILKFLIILLWLNPMHFKETKKYYSQLIAI